MKSANTLPLGFSLMVLIGLAGSIAAQSVPALVNYQGQIQNPNGTTPPPADYTLTFRIYDAAQGGNVIWGPQVFDGTSGPGKGPKIPVVQGYFNVMLGQVDTASRSILTAFGNATRYLEVQVGTNSPIAPRQQLLSAPYAFHSGNADKLAGHDWSSILVSGNDPVAGRINGAKIADGSIQWRQLGSISSLSASDGVPERALDVDANGYVTIGGESQTSALNVLGYIASKGHQSAMHHLDGAGQPRFLTGLRDDLNPALNYVFHSYGGHWIFNSGHVGIGVSSPEANLHLVGNAIVDHAGGGLEFRRSTYDTWRIGQIGVGFAIKNQSDDRYDFALDQNGGWRLGAKTVGPFPGGMGGGMNIANNVYSVYFRDLSDSNYNEVSIEAKTWKFTVGGNQVTALRMVPDPNPIHARVGINTATPTDTLHVEGDLRYTGVLRGPSDRNIKENFSDIDSVELLKRVAALPIRKFNYTNDPVKAVHLGPVAQDFYAAFGLGDDDKSIVGMDADGVALAAIQGLHELVKQKDAEIKELRETLRTILDRMDRLDPAPEEDHDKRR
jgi:hypothetical protein